MDYILTCFSNVVKYAKFLQLISQKLYIYLFQLYLIHVKMKEDN